jgi:ornithine cyclodeaminase/alanine dehydrogenase-like protein (mu-crystallin family)
MATTNNRTTEQVRLELETEREQLADAVDSLRAEVKDATDVSAKLRGNLPVFTAAALGAGFFLAGGVGATMRLLFRRGREGKEKARFGRFSFVDRD